MNLDNQTVIAGLSIIGLVLVTIIQIWKQGSLFEPLTNALIDLTKNERVTSTLDSQFNRLSPDKQQTIQSLVRLVDDADAFMPGDLPLSVVDWLHGITDGLPNPSPNNPPLSMGTQRLRPLPGEDG